ncbi:MAG: hypothetical protein J0L51_12095 [Rhizobiales bacterium]|nr:hypothetical protein [Hyphomicrobiales bacterium]
MTLKPDMRKCFGGLVATFALLAAPASAQQQWPELRDSIDIRMLPHAAYARKILGKCPRHIAVKQGFHGHYRRVLAKHDAIRSEEPSRWKRYEGMARNNAGRFSCAEFASMMRVPERSPNIFLQAR